MNSKPRKNGHVYLIGAGPGDPGLITVRGQECIGLADVIMYDYLASSSLLEHARQDVELIYAGKVGGAHNREQSQINEMLVEKARQGKIVARLKGGDPFIFGRGGEECEALVEAGIPFEVVPGVTAGIGAAAYAGIPLTHRDYTASVAFVTGHESPGKEVSAIDWEKLSVGSGTLVFYMGMKNLPQITANLLDNGRAPETPVALIRWGTRPEQEVLEGTLSDIGDKARKAGFKAPAITVVGEVVRLRDRLRWFDSRPLFGKGIMVTRSSGQAGTFAGLLRDRGARVYHCPTIEIIPPECFNDLDRDIRSLPEFGWVVFTSANGVGFFFDRLSALGLDSRALGSCRVAAVGPKTAEKLACFGIRPDLLPCGYHAEGLVEAFGRIVVSGMRALYPKGDRAGDALAQGLGKLGMEVSAPVSYRSVTPESIPGEVLDALEERRINCVTFTSSSAVANLAAVVGENHLIHLLKGVEVASIGPVTSAACRDLGLQVNVEPRVPTVEALTEAIVSHFKAA